MAEEEIKDWREVITYWDRWGEAIKEARQQTEIYNGQIDQIANGMKVEHETDKSGNVLKIALSEQFNTAWKIENELKRYAERFVINEMGLTRRKKLQTILADYFVKSTCPEFYLDYWLNIKPERPPNNDANKPSRIISLSGNPRRFGKERKIEYSVSWFSDELEYKDIVKFLTKIKWPFKDEDILKEGKGGRPPKSKTTIRLEAVVCYVLSKRQELPHKKIGRLFGWKIGHDYFKNEVCRTVQDRIALAETFMGN